MFENLKLIWQRRGSSERFGLLLGVLLIIAALVWAGSRVLERDWQVLFAGLDPQDAATIVAELDKMKVPYRLGGDETTILVDAPQVHTTRLKLMGKGVNLRGGVGFEIFNNTDFGVTEFAQKINYQRALQGELARSIMALDAVKTARVHLVLPESALFRRAGQKAKASIALTLRDGRSLQPEQVLGIQRLVAASVPQIDASAVTVLDQRGVTLSRAADAEGEESGPGLGGKSDFETYLARKVVAVLDKAFGPGSAIVSIDVTLNHDQVRTTREDVLPHAPGQASARAVVRSRSSVQSGAAPLQAVVAPPAPTAAAEGPAVPATAPARPGASTSEVEYQNGRVVEQTVSRPGGLRRISVGVLLPRKLPAERLKELTHVLAMTVGLNPSRGDEMAISSLDQFAAAESIAAVLPAGRDDGAGRAADGEGKTTGSAQRPGAPDGAAALPSLLAAAIGVTLLVLLAMLFVMWRRSRGVSLSGEERDRLLAQMRQWLAQPQQS